MSVCNISYERLDPVPHYHNDHNSESLLVVVRAISYQVVPNIPTYIIHSVVPMQTLPIIKLQILCNIRQKIVFHFAQFWLENVQRSIIMILKISKLLYKESFISALSKV